MTRISPRSEGPVRPPGSVTAIGYACLAGTALTYGCLWPTLRYGVQIMPPLWFACLRMAAASATLFLLLFVFRRFRLPARQDLPVIFSAGLFMMGLYTIFSHLGMQVVGAGRATLLGYTTPLWVVPMAALLLRERIPPMKAAGLVLGLAGLVALFNPVGFDWTDRAVLTGNGMLLLAAMMWSVSIIQMRTQIYRLTPFQLAPWQLLISAICGLVGALIWEPAFGLEPTTGNLATLVVAGPLLSALGFWFGTMTVRHLPAVTASVGFLGVPVVSTLVAWAFLGETLTATLALGMVVILSGIALVSLSGRRAR